MNRKPAQFPATGEMNCCVMRGIVSLRYCGAKDMPEWRRNNGAAGAGSVVPDKFSFGKTGPNRICNPIALSMRIFNPIYYFNNIISGYKP